MTNGGINGIIKAGSDGVAEKELEYGVPYGEFAVNADMDHINSEEYAKKFDKITENPAVNKTLLECSRAAIKHRTGTLFEDMYLINGNTGEIIGKQLNSECEQGIFYNESIKNAISKSREEKIPLVALHTHPEGYPPSVDDFNKAFENDYFLAVVAGHNGQVYTYNTPDAIVEDPDGVQEDIAFAYRCGLDIDRAYEDTFKNYGLKYFVIKE